MPAHPDFQLTISYNPGYQSAVKDLKESTKQRFVAIDFGYPPPSTEAAIIVRESGTDERSRRRFWSRSRSVRAICRDTASTKARPPAC